MASTATGDLKKNQAGSGKHGGPRPNSGRPKGKQSAPLREIARQHMETAVATLLDVLRDNDAPASARVSAANSILDRGYGKAPQPIDGDGEGGPLQVIIRKGLADG